MSTPTLGQVLEVVLLAAGRAMKLDELLDVLADSPVQADRAAVREALDDLTQLWEERGLELIQVASGYRLQVRADYAPWIARLWAERPARYSRALLETLALIAYRQPITRGEIEDVRGVSVSSSIVKTLLERDWVRVLGHRDVPGRPAIYGTTRTFLDDFSLKGLEDLPPLAEVRDIDRFHDDMFSEEVSEARENAPRGELLVSNADAGEDFAEDANENPSDDATTEESEFASSVEESAAAESPEPNVKPDSNVEPGFEAENDVGPESDSASGSEPESEPGGESAAKQRVGMTTTSDETAADETEVDETAADSADGGTRAESS